MKNWNQTEPEPDVYTTRTKQEPNFLKVLRTRTEPNPYLSDVCTEVSGVENIGQCMRQIKPAQLAFGRTLIQTYLLTTAGDKNVHSPMQAQMTLPAING